MRKFLMGCKIDKLEHIPPNVKRLTETSLKFDAGLSFD